MHCHFCYSSCCRQSAQVYGITRFLAVAATNPERLSFHDLVHASKPGKKIMFCVGQPAHPLTPRGQELAPKQHPGCFTKRKRRPTNKCLDLRTSRSLITGRRTEGKRGKGQTEAKRTGKREGSSLCVISCLYIYIYIYVYICIGLFVRLRVCLYMLFISHHFREGGKVPGEAKECGGVLKKVGRAPVSPPESSRAMQPAGPHVCIYIYIYI